MCVYDFFINTQANCPFLFDELKCDIATKRGGGDVR